MNVVFEYLYRDAGNNKLWDTVSFSNKHGLSVESLDARIRASLIDGHWFVAQEVGIPALSFDQRDSDLDHDWHEFDGLSESADDVSTGVEDIEQVVKAFEASKRRRH